MEENAAHHLAGLTLKTGWIVIEKIEKRGGDTKGFFSVCYRAKKGNEVCFLKAFDFLRFQQLSLQENPNKSFIDVMTEMLNAFKYERDLSLHCRDKNVTKVSFVKESGEENISGFTFGVVPYLIFDMADGDVRKKLDFSTTLDYVWRFKSLRDIAVGLQQLHSIEVAHLDLKPSNILVFESESKLGDLGRSMCKNFSGPYDNYIFSGDWNYAPPELAYGFYETDWHKRVYAADCYLLGSLVVFYFSGVSMNALLMKHLPESCRIGFWQGSLDQIKDYLVNAFSQALNEFSSSISQQEISNELRWIVEKLCYPLPYDRGHPTDKGLISSDYNMERFISKFDLLRRKCGFKLNLITK